MSAARELSEGAPGALYRRVWSGTALLVLGRAWGSACTFVVLFLLARRLAPADFGRFTFYLAVFALLDSLADLGTGAVAVQRTAQDASQIPRVLAATRRIRFVAGLAGVALVGGLAFAAREPGAPFLLLASLYPVTHVLELSATVFKNRIAWRVPVLARAAASAASLAFVLALLAARAREPALYLVGIAAGSALANGLLHAAARPYLPREKARDVPWRELLRASLPLGLAGLCQQAYFYVDNLFVRALQGEVELGHYNVGVRLMSHGIMIAVYASLTALPWYTREHAAGRLGAAIERVARPSFALAAVGAGLALPWAERLLALFGAGFESAGPSLRWLVLAAWTVYLGSALLTGVVAMGATRAVLAIAASGLAVNLVGNALLVPRLGIEGAAIATFVTELAVALGAARALARRGVRPWRAASAPRWMLAPVGFVAALALSSLARGAFVGASEPPAVLQLPSSPTGD